MKQLLVHANNCAGQNKNRFLLMYLRWRSFVRMNDSIFLSFMLAGHTNNVVDGAFGHIKRKIKTKDDLTPSDMMEIVESSSESSRCVPCQYVAWRQRKDFLEQFFKLSGCFSINKYHVFRFESQEPGIIYTKEFSYSTEEKEFKILKCNVSIETVLEQATEIFYGVQFLSTIIPLIKVSSVQKGTRYGYLMHNIINQYYNGD